MPFPFPRTGMPVSGLVQLIGVFPLPSIGSRYKFTCLDYDRLRYRDILYSQGNQPFAPKCAFARRCKGANPTATEI